MAIHETAGKGEHMVYHLVELFYNSGRNCNDIYIKKKDELYSSKIISYEGTTLT